MIKEIFLPEKIGHRRIFAQRIVGISVQEDIVYAVQAHAKRSGTIVENIYEEAIEAGAEDSFRARAAQALKKVVNKIKRYDQIRIAIPASIIVFKELDVPFLDTEKIRMVLDYEIESMLPFSLDEAVIDFIITQEHKEEKTARVLVAAVRNSDLQSILDMYAQADIEPTSITIDLFALYSLYEQSPEYKAIENATALVDLGLHATRISFLLDGQLRLTRFIQRGLSAIVKAISEETNIDQEQVMKKIKTFGIKPTGDDDYDTAVQKNIVPFFNDIQFTLNSFSLKLNYYKGVTKLLFVGKAVEINGLMQQSGELLQIPCETFDPRKAFVKNGIKNKVRILPPYWSHYAMALGAAVSSEHQSDFDLRRKEFELARYELLSKQLIAAFVIVFIALISISTRGYMQISTLQATVKNMEKKGMAKLIELLDKKERPKRPKLKTLVRKVDNKLKEQKDLFAPFAQERKGPLEILFDMTSIIDKKRFNIDVETLEVTEKEPGRLIVEVEGYYQSTRGVGSHRTDFLNDVKPRFESSALLKLTEDIDLIGAEEMGVRFTAKLQERKEEE